MKNLTPSNPVKKKTPPGILQLWFNYVSASFSFDIKFSWEAKEAVQCILSYLPCMDMVTLVCQSFGGLPERQAI